MRGAVLHAPGDVRFEERADPRIIEPTDAIVTLSATGGCGSDLDQVAEGYRATDERRAIKTLLRPRRGRR